MEPVARGRGYRRLGRRQHSVAEISGSAAPLVLPSTRDLRAHAGAPKRRGDPAGRRVSPPMGSAAVQQSSRTVYLPSSRACSYGNVLYRPPFGAERITYKGGTQSVKLGYRQHAFGLEIASDF